MKKLGKILLVVLMVLVIFPTSIKADEKSYKTLNLDEALKEEEIEHDFSNYSENDDQAIIYLFRGKGCGYCKKFLTFLNSIVDEYGKYFKVVSYEVWYNEDNASLMQSVSKVMDQEATGVPFIVIGDKVFAGYSENYDEDIKAAIKKLYDTKKGDRYDAVKEAQNAKEDKGETKEKNVSFTVIAFNIVFTLALCAGTLVYTNKRCSNLEEKLAQLENKKGNK